MKPDEEEICCQALEIQDAVARENYLRHACSVDTTLRQSVEAMLADHERATHLFRNVATGFVLDAHIDSDAVDDFDQLGMNIGPYRILEKLGEGGGGIVYEAEQKSPVRRKVALKVLKPGLDKRRVMNRFQAEREALELMEHPGIARVLDAGVTPDDRPYFVMELVRGVKITEYCARLAAPLSVRLHLVQQVCLAVQHAHQKGIIHCDLKPSNILITVVEGTPIPKVIDFGIAKATAGSQTESLQPAGTPAYMSPEQISGSNDVDTRSDIYSLGVILYELLTGRLPFDMDASGTTITNDARQWPKHDKPPLPSQVARRTSVRLHLDDDLDWMVMTALESDRERRYATMRGLAQDIARYLNHEPILCRPPSRLYRLRKLVRRNRLASAAIVAGVIALAGGFITSSFLYLKAEAAERKQAQLRAEAEEREHISNAAILLLQNKPAEADAEIQRMGDMLTQPSLEATRVLQQLAVWNALRGNWKASSQRLLAISSVNRFDDTDNATRDLLALAPTLFEAGDLDTLEQSAKMLSQRMQHTQNPIAAEHVLKICLLVPPSDQVLSQLRPIAGMAENSLPQQPAGDLNRLQLWRCYSLGLWHYRTGQYGDAIKFLDRALVNNREAVLNSCALAVRSMALRKSGQVAKADADLARSKTLIDAHFSTPLEYDNQGYWFDWLNARILLREASSK